MLHMRIAAGLLLSASLAACSTAPEGKYPSLVIRDAERVTGSFDPGPYRPPPPPAATVADAAAATDRARAANARFLTALPSTRNRVSAARGAGVGSEAWSVAQLAVTDLETAHSETLIALADLDRIYVATSTEGQAVAPVQEERSAVEALAQEQAAIILQLLASLR